MAGATVPQVLVALPSKQQYTRLGQEAITGRTGCRWQQEALRVPNLPFLRQLLGPLASRQGGRILKATENVAESLSQTSSTVLEAGANIMQV